MEIIQSMGVVELHYKQLHLINIFTAKLSFKFTKDCIDASGELTQDVYQMEEIEQWNTK